MHFPNDFYFFILIHHNLLVYICVWQFVHQSTGAFICFLPGFATASSSATSADSSRLSHVDSSQMESHVLWCAVVSLAYSVHTQCAFTRRNKLRQLVECNLLRSLLMASLR